MNLTARGRRQRAAAMVFAVVSPIVGWGLQRSLDRCAGFCRDYPG
ncbi:MAG: hypothetical protein ACT4NP_06405 [Pseudonocardiales bacterium]